MSGLHSYSLSNLATVISMKQRLLIIKHFAKDNKTFCENYETFSSDKAITTEKITLV